MNKDVLIFYNMGRFITCMYVSFEIEYECVNWGCLDSTFFTHFSLILGWWYPKKSWKNTYNMFFLLIYMLYSHTILFFFLIRGHLTLPESALCGPRWGSKTPAVPGSYKRCTPWLELETCCADLKPFDITLRPLGTYCHTIGYTWY